ncbi:MAG TPA: DNA-3-methyladenine glycosylase [Bacteroidales bacterium]|nr:DNA-3-methyladenine glycosylase [Bacteroidales bacterium]
MYENQSERLNYEFYRRDVLDVAPDLLGKWVVLNHGGSRISRLTINEVEAYRGFDDLASHARKGHTKRTEPMFGSGGRLYIYLVYGIHWMLNIVTGQENNPQAVLIRGAGPFNGPGKLTKALGIDHSYNTEDLVQSGRIWIEGPGERVFIERGPRIGVDYAGEYWSKISWRFYIK